mgnify:CR=1 FL=1
MMARGRGRGEKIWRPDAAAPARHARSMNEHWPIDEYAKSVSLKRSKLISSIHGVRIES